MDGASRPREREVWQACDELWALYGDLGLLTGERIRDHLVSLGKSRGSPNEIYRYRATWRENRHIESVSSQISAHSESPDDPISRAVRLVHEKIRNEFEKDRETLKEQHALEKTELNHALDKSKNDLAQLVQEYSASQEKNRELENSFRKASEDLALLGQKVVRLELENNQNKALLLEKESSHKQFLDVLKEAKEAEIGRLQRQLQEEINKQKELGHTFSEELTALKTDLHNAKIQSERLQEQVQMAHEARKIQAEQMERLEEQKSSIHSALIKKETENQYLAEHIDQKNLELAALKEERIANRKENAEQGKELRKVQLRLSRSRALWKGRL